MLRTRYTSGQRRTFALLVIASMLGAVVLVTARVSELWVVVYAAAFPVVFRLAIVASARAEPTGLWRAARVWRAMRRGEIVLHYQPKVTLATGEVTRVEALARWDHPKRGLLAPAEWLGATESRWLEMPFCRHVLSAAIRQAGIWRGEGLDLLVEVNVSPHCFVDGRLPRCVSEALERWNLPAGYIALEITETALELPRRALQTAEQLTAMGVTLALDDFGIGHSSMDRLVRLPFTELKIDKEFVIGMLGSDRRRAVVAAAVSLGHGLGMEVVAEGVEDAATRDRLAAMGCDTGQGFLFSRALPVDELRTWLDARRTERLAPPAPRLVADDEPRSGQRRPT